MNEKENDEGLNGENPKIIWAKDVKIIERKPPSEKIISYRLIEDNEN